MSEIHNKQIVGNMRKALSRLRDNVKEAIGNAVAEIEGPIARMEHQLNKFEDTVGNGQLMTQEEYISALGTTVGIFRNLRHLGLLPPGTTNAVKPRWRREDIEPGREAVRKYQQSPLSNHCRDARPWEKMGFYSTKSAANLMGMPLITLLSWQERGSIEKPQRTVEPYQPRKFYSLQDIEQIKAKHAPYFAERKK